MDSNTLNRAVQFIVLLVVVMAGHFIAEEVKDIFLVSDVITLVGLFYSFKLLIDRDTRQVVSYDFGELPSLEYIASVIINSIQSVLYLLLGYSGDFLNNMTGNTEKDEEELEATTSS